MRVYEGYYLPPSLRGEVEAYEERHYDFPEYELSFTVRSPCLSIALVERVMDHLRESQRRYLEGKPIEEIAGVLDRASRCWLDPSYPLLQQALEAIPALTGFSRPMVAESLHLEHRSSLQPDLLRALESELGNPRFLDGFQDSPQLQGRCRAFGPGLVVAVFSANIPGLPHLSIMRSFLVKAACLGKVSSGEPIFPPLYAKTIEALDPQMAECLAILNWKGGDESIERRVFARAGAVIAYGSEETCASLRDRVPPGVRLVTHSHKFGFGLIGREALRPEAAKELARRAAYDVAVFDQHACLSPHVYFVEEGGEVSPREFARELAGALERLEENLPGGRLELGEAAARQQLRESYELRELAGEEVQAFWGPPPQVWMVVYERAQGFLPSPLNRVIRVVPLRDAFEVEGYLQPLSRYLQNAAVALEGERREEIFLRLARLGVARIVPPGKMPTPSMMWHHDGLPCLGILLRWTDAEMF